MNIQGNFRSFCYILLILSLLGSSCSSQLINPPPEIKESDLTGKWIANYGEGITDTIEILDDGTYNQVYENSNTGYQFSTGWEKWELEIYLDGRVWLYLNDARYYVAGERIGELAGRGDPCPTQYPDCIHGNNPRPFYDPFSTDNSVKMTDRLVLIVRATSEGELILHHMWTSTDRGFGIFGENKEIFTRNK